MDDTPMLAGCPTPWCKGDHGEPYVFMRREDVLGVCCPSCGVSTPYCPTADEAKAIWNTRALTKPVTDEDVERVARALFEVSVYNSIRWKTATEELKDDFRKPARAAINAFTGGVE